MSSKILFVFEGEKTEKQISHNLGKYFVNENSIIKCAYGSNIYLLHKMISDDDDLDTFTLLRESDPGLQNYKRDDFAEIYLFFDYDGHDSSASDEKVKDILNLFNEETEKGKIFISYPMVEALKHYSDSIDFKNLKVNAKDNIKYKNLVSNECDKTLKGFTQWKVLNWRSMVELHLKKMNFVANNEYTFPENHILQIDLFNQQLEKYINVDSTVAVLSAFPIFLFDYYGLDYIENFINEDVD